MTDQIIRHGWVAGLDVGQARDYTALALIERSTGVSYDTGERVETLCLALRHIQRLRLGIPYPEMVEIVGRVLLAVDPNGPLPRLVVDATGVGRPVVDLLRKAGLRPTAVTITGGKDETTSGDFNFAIPKRNLVSALILAFQTGSLQIAAKMPAAEILRTELVNFKAKISTTGHESFDAWREAIHDDLVLATALAVWMGSKRPGTIKPLHL